MSLARMKKLLRKSEFSIIFSAVIVSVILLLLYFVTAKFYSGFISGYLIGSGSYISFVETSLLLAGKSLKLGILLVFITNIKLILIGALVYWLYLLNFSIIQVIFGIFASQLAVTVLIFILHKKSPPSKEESPPVNESN
jgi:hypothetical protein